MPGSHVARATIVLTMDDGSRAVYLLEGGPDCEVVVEMKANTHTPPGILVREIVTSYDYRFDLLNMSATEVRTELPEPAAIEAGSREIGSEAEPTGL